MNTFQVSVKMCCDVHFKIVILRNIDCITSQFFFQLNAAAEVLFASTESSDEEEECTENSPQKATSSNRVSKAETPKRHTIHIDNPDEQRIVQSQQILEYSNSNAHNRGRRASETSLQVISRSSHFYFLLLLVSSYINFYRK